MKKLIGLSLISAMALSGAQAASSAALEAKLNSLEQELQTVKKQLKKQSKKINTVKAHDANDNIKWGVDLRTAIDSINYDMADGSSRDNSSLMSLRLWLNMAYAVDSHNIFMGQLSMNKAFGADFGTVNGTYRSMSMGSMFDWTGNEALSDNTLKVKEAYWLYMGDDLLGSELPWTFSVGRRPSIGGFLANFREDDRAKSPLGHNINVEFDGASTMVKLENLTGISGMSFKVCAGRGSTNWFKAFDLPGMVVDNQGNPAGFQQYGDMQGAAISVLVDGITEDGYFSEVKAFASFAWSQTDPKSGQMMLGSADDESGTSWWLGTLLPVTDDGTLGLEYNHGSKYWRSFTYGEDTMIGSKLAARGDAYEAYFTYKINKALSAQVRYTRIDYDYSGSNGFFGNTSGYAMSISDINRNAAWGRGYLQTNPGADPATDPKAKQAYQAIGMEANTVESADDLRFYIRYRF